MKNKNKLKYYLFGSMLVFFGTAFLNINDIKAALNCPATFIPNPDGTKCVCPDGKSEIAYGYCGDPVAAAENSVVAGTPSEYNQNAGTDSQGQNLFGRPIIPATIKFNYTLLESFPGFFKAGDTLNDFPKMVLAIYKFGIWTVGIAGLFMLVVGGFMYMASAGNTSTASSAQGIIQDALIGITAALGAYLIMYVINPDLTKINLNFTPVAVSEIGPGPSTSGSGNCKPITSSVNACSIDNLKTFAKSKGMADGSLDDWATKASSICNAESSGIVNAASGGTCSGTPIAWGLFQVNLNVECVGAFDVAYSGKRTNDTKKLYDPGCKLIDPAALEKCKTNANNVTWNLNKMWTLYNSRKWQPWQVTLNGTCPNWAN